MGDNKAEGLWQQHDRVIALLSGRLRAEQTAKAEIQAAHQADLKKHAEQTAALASLQAAQAQHAEQVVQLELALDAQTALLQQQESQAQQVLAQTLDKHQSELARLAELEEQASEAVNARLLLSELNAALTAKNALIAQLENDKNQWLKSAKTVVEAVVAPANGFASDLSHIAEPVATVVDDLEAPVKEQGAGLAGKFKGLFGKSKPEPEAEPTVAEPLPEPVPEVAQPEPVAELPETEALAVVQEPTAGVAGKLKGLFGKAKAEPAVAEPVTVAETQAPVEETPPASPEKSTFGKFKGMLASKPAVEEAAPVIAEPAVEPEPAPAANPSVSVFGKLKNLLATHPEAETSPAAAPEPPVEEPAPISPAPRPTGKLKNFFGSKAEVVAEPPVVAEEEPPLAEAATKSTLGKLKGLLGKAK